MARLTLRAKNLPAKTVLDYLSVELKNGKEVTFDFYTSETSVENGVFEGYYKNVFVVDEDTVIEKNKAILKLFKEARFIYAGFSYLGDENIPFPDVKSITLSGSAGYPVTEYVNFNCPIYAEPNDGWIKAGMKVA